MTYTFTIPTKNKKIPSLNEYLKAERQTIRGRYGRFTTQGAIMKKNWQKYLANIIRSDLGHICALKPIVVHYHYYEPDRRRDLGNIHATTQKFVEDALQEVGTIQDDNQKYIRGFTADFHIDKLNPRVVVELEEVGDDEI